MGKYIFAKEIRGETKVASFIHVKDFFFLIIFAALTLSFKEYVNEKIRLFYYIFSAIVAVTLTLPSPINHKRRIYQTIFVFIQKDEKRYHPIRKERKDARSRNNRINHNDSNFNWLPNN